MTRSNESLAISDLCRAEFIAAVSMHVRMRRFDLKLPTPDAIHLGIWRRLGARLLTHDVDQVAANLDLGIQLA